MYWSKTDIENLDRVFRLNLINSVSGIKPANLIGTISDEGHLNLAIFSSVVHLGSHPPLLGFVLRPDQKVRRHTYENILSNKQYTINHVSTHFVEKAHYTSAKFEKGESEFEKCGLKPEMKDDFKAPFVAESGLKMGLELKEVIDIEINQTKLVIGEIQHLIVPEEMITEYGRLDLGNKQTAGISGLNSYYSLQKINEFPYARVNELPDFS